MFRMPLFLVTLLGVLFTVNSTCVNVLDTSEQACANEFGLDANSVLEHYVNHVEDANFAKYLDCVWKGWEWMNENGDILFDNVKKSNHLPWRISRKCDDMPHLTKAMRQRFLNSVNYCEGSKLEPLNAFSLRKCIAQNYDSAQLDF
ncbi:hypothetical protein PPYR_11473 [Photinus pyralis]|uniref:Uncharacterized protein n=1 Tax=Photinus pyralis TaxID=7054 RepID=A0A5N4ABE3_PHOPY|nr:uncharacterized protein LOC116161295 [Photinus pyralis]XP_031351375.1 uncharacterized protein LOC116176753 [Photinus pyralis]KAB0791929.1 hypothetical protein PPYR_03729 [Photinus pyralis]KAB0794634.1 hypothetical protein PPYR_11473 [Photinus pyralis]